MPIRFDLDEIRNKYDCINYFETGLYDPTTNVSLKQALKCNFDKLYSIEIRQDFVEKAKEIFNEDIKNGRLNLYLDDSTNMDKYLIELDKKTLFF